MGMEPLSSISSVQAQTVTRPATTPKISKEVAEGTASEVATPKLDNGTIAVARTQEGNQKAKQGNEGADNQQAAQQQATSENIKRAVDNLNKTLYNSEAVFGIHEKTNRVTIKIVDKETKEVIKEFPPEKTLDMIAKVWEIAGLLVDERR